MEGLSPSPRLFEKLMKAWSRFTLTGERLTRASMNSRGALGFESQELRMSTKDYVALRT
ncbi:MAG: hypothetical protein ACP5M7_07730 [Thermoproteota archaeon]